MKDNLKIAIKEYQCSGCGVGRVLECFKSDVLGKGCGQHSSGTYIGGGVGKIFLGMPKPFMRLGAFENITPKIFETFKEHGEYDKWNVPTWKYKDEHGNTLVRGLMPRINEPFIHVFLENCLEKIDCYELTDEDVKFMD